MTVLPGQGSTSSEGECKNLSAFRKLRARNYAWAHDVTATGNVPGSCMAAAWRVWKPTHFTWVSGNGCQGPVGGRFGDAHLPGVLLGTANYPKFFDSFCSIRSLYACADRSWWEVRSWSGLYIGYFHIWIVTVRGQNLHVLIFKLYLCYIYITRFLNALLLMRVGVYPSPLCF